MGENIYCKFLNQRFPTIYAMQSLLSDCRPEVSAIDVTHFVHHMRTYVQESQNIKGLQRAKRAGDKYLYQRPPMHRAYYAYICSVVSI